MTQIVATGSFRGGTGKSTVTSNLASYLCGLGKKVLIIDTDIRSPGIHAIFGLDESDFPQTFTDYLAGKADIEDAVYDISEVLGYEDETLLLVPSSIAYEDILHNISAKKSHNLIRRAVEKLVSRYKLDYIMIDTHPGINEEALLTGAIADLIITIVRPDNQDYQGAKVSTKIIEKLGAKTKIVMNKLHPKLQKTKLKQRLEEVYGVGVAGALPFAEELMFSESKYVFMRKFPEHEFSQALQVTAANLFHVRPKDRLAVTKEILELIEKKKLTQKELSQKIELATSRFNECMQDLLRDKYIKKEKDTFALLERGKEFLKRYTTIVDFIDDFGL